MIYETIDLYDYYKVRRTSGKGGRLTVYARTQSPELKQKSRPCMLVIPGGGYEMLSSREGEPIALEFLSAGYVSFLLEYSVNTAYPAPLNEAIMAMRYIRDNAVRYGGTPSKVAAIGFSAGGHLTGLIATVTKAEAERALGVSAELVRPDAAILSYPVITMQEGLTHEGTRRVISGNGSLGYESLSIEKRVTAESSPAFIWHTAADDLVPVENSLLLASAYRKAGCLFSLHIFDKGWHGLSLVSAETHNQTSADGEHTRVGQWTSLALNWLTSRGFSVTVKE